MQDSVGALVRDAARRFGDKTALVFEGHRWSFRDLDESSSRVAGHLQKRGIGSGDTVSLFSPNCPEWIIAYYAVMKIGAVVNPLNLMLTPEEAAHAMADCGAVAVFGSDDRVASLDPVLGTTALRHRFAYGGSTPDGAVDFRVVLDGPVAADPPVHSLIDQPCTVCYTSGTTGHPKVPYWPTAPS